MAVPRRGRVWPSNRNLDNAGKNQLHE